MKGEIKIGLLGFFIVLSMMAMFYFVPHEASAAWIDAAFAHRKSITWESSAPTYTFYNETHLVMTLAGMTGVTNATKEIAIYRKPCGQETAGDLHSFWRVLGSDATTSPKIMIDGLNVSTGMQWCVYYDCDTCGEPASRSSGITFDGTATITTPYYDTVINVASANELNVAHDLVNDPAKSTDLFGGMTGWVCGASNGAGGWGMPDITTEKTQPVKNETALQTAPRYFFDQTDGSDLFHARGFYVFWRRNIDFYVWGDGNAGDSYCGAGFYEVNNVDNYAPTETNPTAAASTGGTAWATAIAVTTNKVYQTRVNDSSDKFFGEDPMGSFGWTDKYIINPAAIEQVAMKNTSATTVAEKYLGGYAVWFNYENDTAAKDVAVGLVYPPRYTLGAEEDPTANKAPRYSNITATPASPQAYSAATQYKLNATIVDDLFEGGSLNQVILETNYTTTLTNYTKASGKVTQEYGDNFQMNWTGAYAGTFVYKWYMSDTQGAWNSTAQSTYVVNKITSACTLGLSGTSVTYPNPVTAYCTCNNPEVISVNFTRNGTSIASENNTAVVLGAGGHDYVCNKTSLPLLSNYTTATASEVVAVAFGTATCTLTNPFTFATQNFPTYTQPRCSCTNPEVTPKLYLNGTTNVLSSWNNSLLVLTEGKYDLECNSTATNYSAATDTDSETITLPITFTSMGNAYETEETRGSVNVKTGVLNLDTNAYLLWNSTNKSYDSKTDGGGYDYTFKTNFIVPLIKNNATAADNFWYISIKLQNGTSYNRNSTSETSTIYYSYWLNGLYDNKGRMLEGDNVKIYLDAGIRNISYPKATVSANFTFKNSTNSQQANETNYTISGSVNRSYSHTFNAYMNSYAQIENRTYFGNITIRYQNSSRLMNSTEFYYIPTYQMNITNCSGDSASTLMALNMFLKTEENLTAVAGTFDYTVKVFHDLESNYRNYSFHKTGLINTSICIYPAWSWLTIDLNAVYSADGFSTRTYYYKNNITNTTDFLDFFLLENAYSYPSVVFVRDNYNNPALDYIVKVQRYYAGNNTYKTVLVGKSDSPYGKFSTYLRAYDVFYRFIVEKNNAVITETTPTTIICNPFETITSCPPYPILLKVDLSQLADWFAYQGKIAYSCSVNEETNVFRCTVTDTSGKVSSYNFLVKKKNNLLWDTLCNINDTSTATTFICDLGNRTGNIYQYKVSAFMSNPPAIIASGFLDYSALAFGFGFGTMGLVYTMMITGTLFFIGLANPAVAVLLGVVGIIASYFMGFLPLQADILIGLGLIAVIIIWRLRS